jgi:hypothetical protein
LLPRPMKHFNDILNRKKSSGECIEFQPQHCGWHIGSKCIMSRKRQGTTSNNRLDSNQWCMWRLWVGVERSFTMLPLLLALGERFETFFCVIDEFEGRPSRSCLS